MDYYKADEIGKRSLSNLTQDNWLSKNQSVGKNNKNKMSDKMKAFGPKVKKNSNVMNMIKMLTGINIISSLYKGVAKKSRYNIGKKKTGPGRTINIVKHIMGVPDGGGMKLIAEENSSRKNADVLQKMFDFMVLNETIRQRKAETERSFREEKDNEEQRRHAQFLRALSEFTGVGKVTKVEEKNNVSILDMIKGMWDSFIAPFKWALDWVMTNKKLLLSIARFFAGPFGLALLGGAAIVWLAEQLKQYFKENVPDMKVVSPTEAANLLSSGNQKDIDAFPGGEKALRSIIENGPKRAKEILARGDKQEIIDAGGEKKLKEIEKDIIVQPEKRDAMQDMSPTVTPRATFAGTGLARKSKEQKWDREFGPYYDPITGKRLEKAKPVESVAPAMKPATATPVQESPAKSPEPAQPTAAPVSATPPLGKINDSIAENNTLNLEQSTGGSADNKPVVLQNSKSNNLKDTPISATATTRDETPILEHVRRLSASPI